MRRLRATRIAGIIVTVAAVAMAGNAIAYFSGDGTGNAAAAVTKLTAPTFTAATPAVGGKVTLTWGALTPPGEGTVTYFVTRDGGVPAGNCPSQAAPTTVKTCVDEKVPVGKHSYEVTALWHTWEATSAVKTAEVTVGATAYFTVSATATSIVANGTSNLSITARDENGATVTTYTGSHSIVFSGANAAASGTKPTVTNSSGTATNFGSATALTFTTGVSTVNNTTKNGQARLYQAGTANIVATESSITTPEPVAIAVSATTASKYVLAAATTTPVAGVGDDLTITAQDAYGNLATTYSGAHSLVFSTTASATSPAGNVPTVSDSSGADVAFGAATTIEFSAGIAKASEGDGGEMTLYKTVSTPVKAAEGTTVTTPTALTAVVAAAPAAKLILTSSTPTPVAATGFNLTTTAQDAYGNTATSYAGAKNVTFAGATASPAGTLPTVVTSGGVATNFGTATALNFVNGVATPASSKNGYTKLNKVETASVTATDGTISTVAPLSLPVSIGAANRVALLEVTATPGTVSTACYFTCPITGLGNSGTVKAKAAITDSVGNILSNLAKTITVTATAGGTVTGSPLATPESGLAISATEFTYKSPASGNFSHTITAASTGYTSATSAVSK
jgi:hypothetical protein